MDTTKNKGKFLEVLALKGGNISEACLHFEKLGAKGFHRTTVYKWKRKDAEFAKRLQEFYDVQMDAEVDQVESALITLAKGKAKYVKGQFKDWDIEPDVRAIKLVLEAKAKRRGYGNTESTVTIKSDNRSAEEIQSNINNLKTQAEQEHYDISKD